MKTSAAAQSTSSLNEKVPLPDGITPNPPPAVASVWIAVATLLLAVVLFLRKPDSLLNPQFWAEDGNLFFLEAYDHGLWWTLLRPTAGYLNTVPRLVAGLAVLLPLRVAPLVFNLAAFLIQMLPVPYLLGERMGRWIPDRRLRVGVALLYVLVPNSYETYVILDNCQWNLALVGLLLLVADPPPGRLAKAGDLLLLALFSWTGPFTVILLPLALLNLLQRRRGEQRGWFAAQTAVVAAGAATQIFFLLTSAREAAADRAWPTLQVLVKILSTHIFFNSLLGMNGSIAFSRYLTPAAQLAGLALTALLAIIVLRSRHRPLVWLLYLAGTTIFSSLRFTPNSLADWLWPEFGPRYYTSASLFVLYAIVLLCVRGGRLRLLGALLALPVLVVALPRDFAHPGDYAALRRPDTHYPDQIAVFETLPAGASFFIPTLPDGWGGFVLRKKTATRAASPLEGLQMLDGKPAYFLEEPSTVMLHTGGSEPYVRFSGWAADTAAKELAGGVWLEVDGRLFPALSGKENRFAELMLRDQRYRMSGFSRDIPLSELNLASHRLSLIVLTHDRRGYYRTPWRFITLRSLPKPLP
jgi:hypothetical protein